MVITYNIKMLMLHFFLFIYVFSNLFTLDIQSAECAVLPCYHTTYIISKDLVLVLSEFPELKPRHFSQCDFNLEV